MKNRLWLLSCLAVILAVILLAGCSEKPSQQPGPGAATAVKGVSFSPKSMDQAGIDDFFAKARQTGGIVSWAGDWDELSGTAGGANFVASQASSYGCVAVIEPSFFTQSTGALLRPLDDTTVQRYVDSAAEFAAAHKVKYLGIGIEVNLLAEKSPADFEKFVKLFADTYDAVKKKSPETKVFTVFQLEHMKGLKGGLFGGVNDPATAEWALIDRFPKADLIGITTYPGLIYKDPSEIPADYYAEIKNHTSKPVAFTEIGWQSEAWPTGWESNDTEQAAFVTRFFELTGGLNKEMAIWSFLYDMAAQKPFDSMGLIKNDGTMRPSYDAWIKGG
jgi:hypothetical protein